MKDEKELFDEINKLRHDIKTNELNKSFLIMAIVLVGAGLIGGGLLLGSIFGQVGLGFMAGVFATIPALATKVKELGQVNTDIKYSNQQIATYEHEIIELQKRRIKVNKNAKKQTASQKKDYSFKKSKESWDIPLDAFDELESKEEVKPKSR